jgi:hypothetical protein
MKNGRETHRTERRSTSIVRLDIEPFGGFSAVTDSPFSCADTSHFTVTDAMPHWFLRAVVSSSEVYLTQEHKLRAADYTKE